MEFYTAESYKGLEVRDAFQENGKWYGYVTLKSNPNKKIRLYEKAPKVEVSAAASSKWNARKGFGFGEAGYITIFAGEISSEDEYFSRSVARYCVRWGWYIVSDDPVPADIPYYATPKKLLWSSIGNEDNTLKDNKTVNAAVNALIFGATDSKPVGKVGERLELLLTVVKAAHYETQYGTSTIHTFKDADGNLFKWTTNARDWEEGSVHRVKSTVKEHKDNVTILTRCTEVK